MSTRLLAFSGSLRGESFNTRLAFLAADLAESKGAVVTRLKLQDLNLPMFDEDSEATSGLPAGAKELKDLMRAHDGFLIATPEYNGFMSGALKNAIDYCYARWYIAIVLVSERHGLAICVGAVSFRGPHIL